MKNTIITDEYGFIVAFVREEDKEVALASEAELRKE